MFIFLFLRKKQSLAYTYFIDPISGNDSNMGTSVDYAWLTTTHSDLVTLTGTQTIGYKYNGTWYLYRSLNMTANETNLIASIVTAQASQF